MRAVAEAVDTIKVFVPVGKAPPERTPTPAKERDAQAALVVGFLDNHKHNTGKILDRLEERLRDRYAGVRVVRMKKPEAGKRAPKDVIDALARECQAVVTGVGD